MSIEFPPELEVNEGPSTIEFKSPVNISQEVKKEVIEMQFGEKSTVIIAPKPRANKVFILKGGNPEMRRRVLLYILSHTKDESGKVLFEHDGHMFQLKLLKNFSDKVQDDMSVEQLKAIPELQYDKWSVSLAKETAPDVKTIDKCEMIVSPKMASAIVATLGDHESLRKFGEPGFERRAMRLRVPAVVPVGVELLKDPMRYKFTFCQFGPHKPEEIAHQLKDLAIPLMEKKKFLLCEFKETDPIPNEKLEAAIGRFNVNFVRLPEEGEEFFADIEEEDVADARDEENEDWLVSTSLLINTDGLSAEQQEELKKSLQELFQQIRLVWCKKCAMSYCPAVDKICYKFFHKGKREGMEEVDVDEEGNEVIYEHWTCCGDCVKGEVPTQCGREPNGEHEQDTAKGEASSFTIKEVQVSNKQ